MANLKATFFNKQQLNSMTHKELVDFLISSGSSSPVAITVPQTAIADVAGNMAGLTAAFNTLLAELRAAGILET